jgi:hypothetical protein
VKWLTTIACLSLGLISATPLKAGEADVIDARVSRTSDGRLNFDVTIRSNDTGWSYYADGFEVLGPDGSLLGERVLYHPHETEQPFTRDLYGVTIPTNIDKVIIRAHHKVKGYDGETLIIQLPDYDFPPPPIPAIKGIPQTLGRL